MRTTTTAIAAGALAALATTAPAQTEVSHECSGIGAEGREAAESVPHTLRLVYARPNGQYLGGVETRIAGRDGELVNVRCPGPWVLVDLPDGTYEVTATFQNQTKSTRVTIRGGGRQQQVFTF